MYQKTSKVPLCENALLRPRVDALLEAGLQEAALLVSGGPGFGKTQAVACFLARRNCHAVWQQLTTPDNLPLRFWESFTHTISLHRPALAEKLMALGFPESLQQFHRFLQLLTGELYADELPVALVFDDFYCITDAALLRFFGWLRAAKLENICMIFITRTPDLAAFHELRHHITGEDLRFTRQETKEYFAQQKIPRANEAVLDEIYDYTAGWPMALYLVANTQPGERPQTPPLQSSRARLFQLMEQAVFSQYSSAEKHFFLSLPLLHFFPKELLLRLAPQEDVTTLLRENLFVTVDAQAERYYLHRLFLDFLTEHRAAPDAAANHAVWEAAGDWCRENQYFVDALHYYARCKQEKKIIEVIQSFDGLRHSRADAELFIRYIENLSEEFLQNNLMCRIVLAMLYLNNLEIDRALAQMQLVFAQLDAREDTPENRLLRGEALIGTGLIDQARGCTNFAQRYCDAKELLPNGSGRWGKNFHLVAHSNVFQLPGIQAGAAAQWLQSCEKGLPALSVLLHGAACGAAQLAQAEHAFFTGDFRLAQQLAYEALYEAQGRVQEEDIRDNARFLLLRIFLATGDAGELEKLHAELAQSATRTAELALGWFFSEIDAPECAADWIRYEEELAHPPISIDKDMLLQIRCLMAQEDYCRALALTRRLERVLQKRALRISLLYVQVYRAVICYQLGDSPAAAQALSAAYALASENEIVTPFVEFGHKTRAMLRLFAENGCADIPAPWLAAVQVKAASYAKRRAYLISHFKQLRGAEKKDYSLTARERELLQNLSRGLTRDEIAEGMYISPHTVKSMLKIVYNKLGAVNSADAVRIAGAQGLIVL